MTGGPTRRELLAGTTLGAGVALAGCIGDVLPGLGGSDRYDPPLPTPEAIGGDRGFPAWLYRQPSALADRRNEMGAAYQWAKYGGFYNRYQDLSGLRFEELDDLLVTNDGVNVLEGEFDRAIVEYELHESGMERYGSTNGYDQWSDPDGTAATAIDDGAVVVVDTDYFEGIDQHELVDAVVEAQRGDTRRYAEANDDLETLLERLGTGEYVGSYLHPPHTATDVDEVKFAGRVGSGTRKRIEDDRASVRAVFVYESAEAVDLSAVERYFEDRHEDRPPGQGVESLTVDRRGRTAVVSWTAPLDVFA